MIPQRAIRLYLANEEATRSFAEFFSRAATLHLENAAALTILLNGDLGCGKTTFVRYAVRALPGGTEAEVASPSFTLCNIYPTKPPVWHCDLYRLGPDVSDDSVEAAFDEQKTLIFIEWGQWLKRERVPVDHVEMNWHGDAQARQVEIVLYGQACVLEGALREYANRF